MTGLNITEVAAAVEQACSTLESEIAALRAQKHAITAEIKTKQAELDLAESMRPRKRKGTAVPDVTAPAE